MISNQRASAQHLKRQKHFYKKLFFMFYTFIRLRQTYHSKNGRLKTERETAALKENSRSSLHHALSQHPQASISSLTSCEAVLQGLAADGGLFVTDEPLELHRPGFARRRICRQRLPCARYCS